MRRRFAIAGGAAALTLAAGGALFIAGHRNDARPHAVAQFTDQGVTVTLKVEHRTKAQATLAATFTPQQAGFHLYSVDLPADGIQGVGRPIALTVQGGLTAAGKLTTDAPVTMLPLSGTTITLPVYPPGPVTVDLPVTITAQGRATVLVGYAACSPANCLPPVTNHPIPLDISDADIRSP